MDTSVIWENLEDILEMWAQKLREERRVCLYQGTAVPSGAVYRSRPRERHSRYAVA